MIIVGDTYWLRNDYVSPIEVNGIEYPTVEHAYQAAKFTSSELKKVIANSTLRDAREAGRGSGEIRDDWDDIREITMETLLRQKFSSYDELASRLVKTRSEPIVMQGYDKFWGLDVYGDGSNKLGELLQKIRVELQLRDDDDMDPVRIYISNVKNNCSDIKQRFKASLDNCQDRLSLFRVQDEFLGKDGELLGLVQKVDELPYEAQQKVRDEINSVRRELDDYFQGKLYSIKSRNTELENLLKTDPSPSLVSACQDLYTSSKSIMTLVDTNDFDAEFISKRTGVDIAVAKDAIANLKTMIESIHQIRAVLGDYSLDNEIANQYPGEVNSSSIHYNYI